jgi:hypothetical protein
MIFIAGGTVSLRRDKRFRQKAWVYAPTVAMQLTKLELQW